MNSIMKFVRDEEGATMVEYALMIALIAVACMLTITTLGTTVNAMFQAINTAIANAMAGGS
jgi:pilus assembly protein Flp/PilA